MDSKLPGMDNTPKTPHICYISLGSNLGNREGYLLQAKRWLQKIGGIPLESGIYETEPWGYHDQPKFLNQVIRFETCLGPLELLKFLKRIENRLGRQKTILYGPRVIDLDILFYDLEVLNLPGLTIPHPAMENRAFILVPLAEIAPDMVHPVLQITIIEMLSRVETDGVIKYNQ